LTESKKIIESFCSVSKTNNKIKLSRKQSKFYDGQEQFCYIDFNGENMTEFFYETAYLNFNCGLAMIKHYQDNDSGKIISTKYGFVNKNGVVIIPLIYDFAINYISGYSIVTKENKDGLIDTDGKEIIPFIYDSISYMYGNYYRIEKNKKYGIIDTNRKEIIPIIYDLISYMYDKYYRIKNNNKYGILDIFGNMILKMEFDMLEFLKENLFIVRNNGTSSLISLGGEKKDLQFNITSICWIALNKFLIGIDDKDKYGAIDMDGKSIIPFCYSYFYSDYSKKCFEFYNDDDKVLTMNFEGRIYEKNVIHTNNERFENDDDYDSNSNGRTYNENKSKDSAFQELRFDNCSKLTNIECWSNQLSYLCISDCKALIKINCWDNQLSSLDVSKCNTLTQLRIY